MSNGRFLVTGALGCVGAWTVRELLREGTPVVGFDLGENRRRLAQILEPADLGRLTLVRGDITKLDEIERTLDEHGITNVIHLAALQVPFCRADPPAGAAVNVLGTVNVFEAVRRRGLTSPVVYASSMAAYSADDLDPNTGRLEEDAEPHPANHYGVYKVANEGNARIYWAETGVASVGVRPMTVYGVGRDQGMTSGPTVAIAAAVLGEPYEIGFGGSTVFQYAGDVAKTLLLASRSEPKGAKVYNLGGEAVAIADWVAAIEDLVPDARGTITVADIELPFPPAIAHESLAELGNVPVTPFRDGIAASAEIYRRLAAEGRLSGAEQGVSSAVSR
ncbi:MAG TPA: SDR family oxidoreductase [Candidatus Limnocylindrales bacterium]|nr:SDR family oxidoreductase [Candidatus Limnocylindrales bacterium]